MLNRQLGSYTILSPLGVGGMGEVYRAHDSKLGRDVAIKILPPLFTDDPERRARFAREARVLATLNHPNIAAIYGLEESNGVSALVLELVDGVTLADRIARGPLRLTQAVAIARQVVDALEAAHEQGIVHRDLKPANVMLQSLTDVSTTDIRAKVLDFGLAKPATKQLDDDPTISVGDTAVGRIIGTPPYMSPEQARGLAVDARTDVWAFGCVLYEMIVGRPAFRGATTSDTIAKILEHDPDWQALPPSTPASIRRLLTRCLEKDPKRRLHSIADATFDLDEALTEDKPGVDAGAVLSRRAFWRWAIAGGIVAVIVAAGAWKLWTGRTPDLPSPRVMPLTSYQGIESSPTFSPDGKQVAFSWNGERADNDDIYVLIVGVHDALRITRNPARDISPAWKPSDTSQIAFVRLEGDRASVYLISALGGSEQKLADFARTPYPGSGPVESSDPRLAWSPDGRWLSVTRVASDGQHGVFIVAPDGTKMVLLSAPNWESYASAVFSPTGDKIALIHGGAIELAELTSRNPPTLNGAPRPLTSYLGYVGGLAWTPDGKSLVFGRSRYPSPDPPSLWRLAILGDAKPERFDLAGVASYPAVSTAASRLAFVRRGMNIDLLRLEDGRAPETLLPSTGNEQDASFSPDGLKIAYASDRTGDGHEVWVADVDGSNRRSLTNGAHKPEGSPRWSPNGDRIAFDGEGDDGLRHVYLIDPAGGQIQMIASKPGFRDQVPSWSRDGKWIYFGSNRSGRPEVWRVPASGGNAEQVTTSGGEYAYESWDGRTLYYLRPINRAQTVFAMPVAGGPERPLGIELSFWNYVPGENGVFYVPRRQGQHPPYTLEVRFLDTTTGQSRVVHSIPLADASPGLTVTRDGKTVVVAGTLVVTQDLMRIENFR